jgi:hypothetical protein
MNHLRRLGNQISISIRPDEDGFTGRECPNPDCESYFKIEFGTGLKGDDLPCHCPYCGHTAPHNHFWTKEQLEYAQSVAFRKITDAFVKDLKQLEFDHKPRGGFGIGISLKINPGSPTSIRYYREKRLETEVVCANCTLRYSVFGVFAFCPDCGLHNSLQILDKNLDLVGKMLDLSLTLEKEVSERLIENALEDCVSSFDGFGREMCAVHAKKATDSTKATKVSFQNLDGAKQSLQTIFAISLDSGVSIDDWKTLVRGFQKRHVISHKMGVADDDYVRKSGDPTAVVGRKIYVTACEVTDIVHMLRQLAQFLCNEFTRLP